jgi:SAM-dependent methyltransferase
MRETHRSELEALIRGGAATQDIHDDGGADDPRVAGHVDDAFVRRELDRVAIHLASLVPPLRATIGHAARALDFGCGTGGTTVALALSGIADEVVGVDANPRALRAAQVRGAGHDLAPPRLRFEQVAPASPLPFADAEFDLVVTVSVFEFIATARARDRVAAELRRVVRPSGHLFIATPRPALRQYHSGHLLGDLRRSRGMAWSSPPWRVTRWGGDWDRIPVPIAGRAAALAARVPLVPRGVVDRAFGLAAPLAGAWQRLLVRRPL